ncbi:MAG: UvrD-helicase domain-containing protein, partial [Bdellovibrionales bacterium]|nr:UvrD-helicase domain-containing protein [Bdellovibrionales bacterium]
MQLASFLDDPAFNAHRAQEILSATITQQHRLSICTLDGLFGNLLSRFSLELGLPSDWQIVDESTDRLLRDAALRTTLAETDQQQMTQLLRMLARGRHTRSVWWQLSTQVLTLHELYHESTFDVWNWLPAAEAPAAEDVARALSEFPRLELPLTGAGVPDKRWAKARETNIVAFLAGDWEAFLKSGFAAKVFDGTCRFGGKELPANLQAVIEILVAAARAELVKELRAKTLAIYSLLDLFHRHYDEEKRARGMLRFGDVKSFLSKASVAGELDSLYYRLDLRFRHLLLDEFQDTSREEWCILQPLVDEVIQRADEGRSFFCVGDVKQAIYGWRGGVAEIFSALEDRYPSLQETTLDVSYRSAPPVIDCVNRIFGNLQQNSAMQENLPAVAE